MTLVMEAPAHARTQTRTPVRQSDIHRSTIHCAPDTLENLLHSTDLEPQEITILEQLGCSLTKKMGLQGVTLETHPLHQKGNEFEVELKQILVKQQLKIATFYEWVCLTATQPNLARLILEQTEVCLMGFAPELLPNVRKETLIVLHWDRENGLSILNAKTPHSLEPKPRSVAGVYLTK